MWNCKICGTEFATKGSMNAHQVAHKSGKRYSVSRAKPIIKNCNCICVNCGIEYKGRPNSLFCSLKCQADKRYSDSVDNWEITSPGKRVIKKYLALTFGAKCSVCDIIDWNNKPIVLELEHKDGNSENNSKENLCLICPNCHSQTSTYKNRNKGNGRHARRQRYAEGKSY